MANKQISVDMKELILKLKNEGNSFRQIAVIVKKPLSSVHYVIKTYNRNGFLERPRGSGRPKKISTQQIERRITRTFTQNPKISAVQVAKDLERDSIVSVHPQTIRNFLHTKELRAYKPRNKPLLSAKNIKKRFEYAKEFVGHQESFWNTVIFADESKFNIFGSDGRRFVWRRQGTALDSKNLNATVKHGGGSVMVWGAFGFNGVGNLVFVEGNMNKIDYLNILRQNLPETAAKLGLTSGFRFVHDNDPKHSSFIVREWLLYNTLKVLPHPPQSPDLNPIEHLWAYMEKKLREKKISSKAELKAALREIWENIPSSITSSLVSSMGNRMQAVLQAKGHHTKY